MIRRATLIIGIILPAMIFAAAISANAATLVVTKTTDTDDGVCDADCSLREAITAAVSGDEIDFASPLFDTPQEIACNGTLEVWNKSLRIMGPGADLLTIRITVNRRVFDISSPFRDSVGLSGMTITGGNDSTAGGIVIVGDSFFNLDRILVTLTGVHVTGNTGDSVGGVNGFLAADLVVVDSTVSNNSGGFAGGIVVGNGGRLTMKNSTISGNRTTGSEHEGAAGVATASVATITTSTITDNEVVAGNSPGGVYAMHFVTVESSIIAGNRSGTDILDVGERFDGNLITQGYNLIGNPGSVTAFNSPPDQTGTPASPLDPQLEPLGNFGGTMPTHRPMSTSPAIDKGFSSGRMLDQRGFPRVADHPAIDNPADGSDIGAVELEIDGPTYVFTGFFQPIVNLPAVNEVKAGGAVPVKFSLSGDQGLDIFAPGFPASSPVACEANEPSITVDETAAAGTSSLQYDASIDQYTYVWKTNRAWKGTCRVLIVRLIDGSDHLAKFRFK